jgi:hypothetical protein
MLKNVIQKHIQHQIIAGKKWSDLYADRNTQGCMLMVGIILSYGFTNRFYISCNLIVILIPETQHI